MCNLVGVSAEDAAQVDPLKDHCTEVAPIQYYSA